MVENTDGIRRKPADPAKLGEIDRKLLALLAEDSTRSYAELGRFLHLSAPAVHERTKRLKQESVIRATAAWLDGAKIGRPLLAFVHVHTTSWAVTRQLLKLKELPGGEEIHTVTGHLAVAYRPSERSRDRRERSAAQSAHTRHAKPRIFA